MVRAVLKSYRKNILREMKDNLSRMVSLFGIVALGVMMLTGLMSFAPSMRIAGQKYYVQQNVFDLRALSTLGLSEEDIAAIAAVDGVEAVQPVKYQDVEAQWQGQSETAVVRLQQLPADPGADTAENMNRLVLLSGRMPEAPDECVVHVMGYGDPVEPGTVLTLPEDTEHVSRKQFTVVGTVQDPQHFSTDKESSTAGDGQLDDIVFLPEGSLTTDYYTACYLKVKNAGLYDNYSDEYQAAVDDTAARVKAISGAQCTARRAELIEDASAELADARAEYNDKKAEADRQFAEAEQRIAPLAEQPSTGKTVAFFSITSNGLATVRKGNDYVARMIEMAGGDYAFADLTDNGNNLATVNLSLENFYAGAKDADVLIYNSTIEGVVHTTEELVAKCPLLAEFKAVQSGSVWCTTQSFFQQSTALVDFVLDLHRVFTENDPADLQFLRKVE